MDPAEPEPRVALPLAATAALAAVKLWAATLTGSSALFAEAVRSLADFSSQMLMLNGVPRPGEPPGGRDVAFWALVAPVLLYALAAGVVAYEGIDRLARPRPVTEAPLAYGVLAISLAFQAALAWSTRPTAGNLVGMSQRVASTIGVLVAAIALAGFAAGERGGVPEAEGVATMLVGLGLLLIAALLALAVRHLLAASPAPAAQAEPAPPTPAVQGVETSSLHRRRKRRRQ